MTHDGDARPLLGGEFKSLIDPAEVIEVGRIDLVGDMRPGRRLVAAVKSYDFRDGQPRPTRVQEETTFSAEPRLAPTPVPEDECEIEGELGITPDVDEGPEIEPELAIHAEGDRRRVRRADTEEESDGQESD